MPVSYLVLNYLTKGWGRNFQSKDQLCCKLDGRTKIFRVGPLLPEKMVRGTNFSSGNFGPRTIFSRTKIPVTEQHGKWERHKVDKNEAVCWHTLERDDYYSKAKAYWRRTTLSTSEPKYCGTHAEWLLKRFTANLHISVVVLRAGVSCITIQCSL